MAVLAGEVEGVCVVLDELVELSHEIFLLVEQLMQVSDDFFRRPGLLRLTHDCEVLAQGWRFANDVEGGNLGAFCMVCGRWRSRGGEGMCRVISDQ